MTINISKTPFFSPLVYFSAATVLLSIMFLAIRGAFLIQQGASTADITSLGFAVLTLIAFITSGAIVLAVTLTQKKFSKSWELFGVYRQPENSIFDFLAGLSIFTIIGMLSTRYEVFKFAVLDTTSNVILEAASVVGGANPFWSNFLTTIGAPTAEEFLFFAAFFGVLVWVFTDIGNIVGGTAGKIIKHPVFQSIFGAILIGMAFSAFHVGQQQLQTFLIAAFVFRAIILLLSIDARINFIPGVTVGFIFALGGHIANNIQASGGFWHWFTVMLTASELLELVAAAMVFIMMALVIYVPIKRVYDTVVYRKKFVIYK